jgi:sensor c-di-GMP phosphodiesterase-like protein
MASPGSPSKSPRKRDDPSKKWYSPDVLLQNRVPIGFVMHMGAMYLLRHHRLVMEATVIPLIWWEVRHPTRARPVAHAVTHSHTQTHTHAHTHTHTHTHTERRTQRLRCPSKETHVHARTPSRDRQAVSLRHSAPAAAIAKRSWLFVLSVCLCPAGARVPAADEASDGAAVSADSVRHLPL